MQFYLEDKIQSVYRSHMKLKFYILVFYFILRNTAQLHLKYCTEILNENMKHRTVS